MSDDIFKFLPEIIRRAAETSAGFLALTIVLLCFVALAFFKNSLVFVKVWIFLVLLVALIGFAIAATSPSIRTSMTLGGEHITRNTAIVPAAGVRNAHTTGSVTVVVPEGFIALKDKVITQTAWENGDKSDHGSSPDGSGWGRWSGLAQVASDGRTVTRTYDHWKHDRARLLTMIVPYVRAWTMNDTLAVWCAVLSVMLLGLALLVFRKPSSKETNANVNA